MHHHSDEVAWLLDGEIPALAPSCNVAHAWKNTGNETGRVLFLYTPAAAGGYIEAMADRHPDPMTATERDELCARYCWKILGPNPL